MTVTVSSMASSPAMKSKEMSPIHSLIRPVGTPPGLTTCEARTSCARNRVPPAFLPNPERADELRGEIAFLLRREHEAVTIHGRKRVVPGHIMSLCKMDAFYRTCGGESSTG